MKTIVCIGCGVVGYATCLSLSSLGHRIIGIDKSIDARNQMIKSDFSCFSGEEILFEGKLDDTIIDIILLALPTPFCSAEKTLSDRYLISTLPLLSYLIKKKPNKHSLHMIIQSTVAIGTSEKLFNVLQTEITENVTDYHLFYHPEFLREEKSQSDAFNPIKQVFAYVGGKPQLNFLSYQSILEDVFSPVGSSRTPITIMSSAEEAEYLKLVHNFSNAMRVSFSNCCAQVAYSISSKFHKEINPLRVLSIVSETAESFSNNKYGIIPGYPYSGQCLPKDVQCLMNMTDEEPYRQFLQSVHLINQEQKDLRCD